MSNAIQTPNVNQEPSYQDMILQGTTESARIIFRQILLHEQDLITAKEILEKSSYSSRTVRYSIKILLNLRLIEQIPNLQDCRSHYYRLSNDVFSQIKK